MGAATAPPEPRPAEHLSRLVDEPIVNQPFDEIADIQERIEQRDRDLEAAPDTHLVGQRAPSDRC